MDNDMFISISENNINGQNILIRKNSRKFKMK